MKPYSNRQKLFMIPSTKVQNTLNNAFSLNDTLRSWGFEVNGNTQKYLKEYIEYHKLIYNFNYLKHNKNINEKIFESIKTKEQDYWLGFIAADGHVPSNSNRVSFTLSVKDESHLDRFINFIGGDLSAKTYSIGSFKTKRVHFAVYNKKISSDLKKLGLVSPKTKNLKFIEFKKESLSLSFLLGFYDGDGTEKSPSICCGSKTFLNSIKKQFNLPNKIVKQNSKLGSVYILYFGMNLYRKIANNYKNSLPRKRNLLKPGFLTIKNKCKCGELKVTKAEECKKCQLARKTPIDFELVKTLFSQGKSMAAVGREFGLTNNALKKRILKEGLELTHKTSFKEKQKIQKQIINLYKKNKSVTKICDMVKLSKSRVSEVIREYRVKHEKYKPSKRKINWERVVKHFNRYKDYHKTANHFNIHIKTARKIVKKS